MRGGREGDGNVVFLVTTTWTVVPSVAGMSTHLISSSVDSTDHVLAAHDLHKSFGRTPALAGASVSMTAGEIVAVMGPSGSGKSTLLHCMAGILRPDAGEVHYRGSRLDRLPEDVRSRLRRDDFGFVFQFGQLVPELSSLENVTLPLRLGGVRRR